MPNRFRLKRLDAASWRGIGPDGLSIPLDQPLNIVYGPNGSGKSSLLTAIEWALFPRETVRLSDHGIGERREWETRYIHASTRPKVRLWIANRNGEVEVGGATASPVRATYADFKGLAFLHQETLRDFVAGTPGARQAAFQRLLGAGWAQDLGKAFESAAKDLDADQVDTRVAHIEDQLHTRLLEARRQLGDLEVDAAAAGLAPPWEQAEARLAAELAALEQSAPASPAASATTRRLRLESWRAAWQSALARRQASPSPDAALLPRLVAERDRALESLRALDRYAALLRDALAHVRDHPRGAECPVCEQPAAIPMLAASLESRLGTPLSAEAESLRARLSALQTEITAADRARAEAARVEAEVDRARHELAAALGRNLHAAEDPGVLVERELERLAAELAREQQALEATRARLSALERAKASLSLVRRVAGQARRVAKLQSLRQSSEWTAMLEAQRRIGMRELLLQHAAAAVKTHATALAAENLARAGKPITNIYTQLTRRKDFPLVSVEPRDKFEVAVANAENRTIAATGILNLTDLNCLALALTAGMAVAFPNAHDLDFLIFDDPSQSMDAGVCARLAPILGHLAKRLQVVVATPDEALFEALRAQPVYKNVITLAPRDPDDPKPRVRIASIEQ